MWGNAPVVGCQRALANKTSKTPEQLMRHAVGVFARDMKSGELVVWLKQTDDLGHGHSMAIWAVFKDRGWVDVKPGKG